MATPKDITWSRLPDKHLKTLGAKDSVRLANGAITEHLRNLGINNPWALVISDTAVICPEGSNGIVTHTESRSQHARVAFNEDDKNYCVADRVTCALAILGSRGECPTDAELETLRKAQFVLSEMLLLHPVLLHPRLVIPVQVNKPEDLDVEHMTVFSAMTKVDAQFPSVTQGINPDRVKAFAKSKLITAPIVQNVPRKAYRARAKSGKNLIALNITGSLTVGQTIIGIHNMPAFMASVLEIGRLRDEDWLKPSVISMISALPLAVGMYAYNKQGTSIIKGTSYPQLTNEIRIDEIINKDTSTSQTIPQFIKRQIAIVMQERLLQTWGSDTLGAGQQIHPQWVVEENTKIMVNMLETIGLVNNKTQAAQWLHLYLVDCGDYEKDAGERENRKRSGSSMTSAIGFLNALAAFGMKLPDGPATNSEMERRGVESRYWDVPSNFEIWQSAHDVVNRTLAMNSVLNAARESGDKLGTSPVEPEPNMTRNRRRIGI